MRHQVILHGIPQMTTYLPWSVFLSFTALTDLGISFKTGLMRSYVGLLWLFMYMCTESSSRSSLILASWPLPAVRFACLQQSYARNTGVISNSELCIGKAATYLSQLAENMVFAASAVPAPQSAACVRYLCVLWSIVACNVFRSF